MATILPQAPVQPLQPQAPVQPLEPMQPSATLQPISFPKTKANPDPSLKMKAVIFKNRKSIEVGTLHAPAITEPNDAIIRITTSAICGSDLSVYRQELQGIVTGDIMGHEAVGIVHKVGDAVKFLRPGDRVVIAANIACGLCLNCKNQNYVHCDNTNSNRKLEDDYGQRSGGVFGYSQLKGGYDGLQAEYARVPFADVNCLKVTNSPLNDERLIWLSDALPTAWYANELSEIRPGSSVAIWGAGPVGLVTAMIARYRGAAKVVCIDYVPHRLAKATQIGATSTIDPGREKVISKLKELAPLGFDACIDAAGFRIQSQLKHKVMKFMELEVSGSDFMKEAAFAARKGGIICVIGEYYQPLLSSFPIGAFMEKGLQLRGGHVSVQRYWASLLTLLETNKIDPLPLVSHILGIEKAPAAYTMFDKKRDSVVKVVLRNPAQA